MLVELCTMLLLLGVVFVTIIGVIDRFLLGLGLAWTEELARFLLIWTSFLAAVVATRRGSHFKVEILARRLGRKGAQAVALFCLVVSLAVCWYGIRLTLFFHAQSSPALGLPMSVIYGSVPVSFALIAYYLGRSLVAGPPQDLDRGERPPP